MKLTRDTRTGKILDNGTPIMLRGGHYDLFIKDNKPGRGLARPSGTTPFVVAYNNAPPCVGEPPKCSPMPAPQFRAKLLTWSDENSWRQLFGFMRARKCNLLRIWLTAGTRFDTTLLPGEDPFDLTPFIPVKRGREWKWKVFHAVERGQWNNAFFDRLRAFADAADAAGVCLQICLFNYFDLTPDSGTGSFRTWSQSPWNPERSDNPAEAPDWGDDHLVKPPDGSPPSARHGFFIKPTNRLPRVQRALIHKTVQTLAGKGNIIIEVINEPRHTTPASLSLFNSNVYNRIRDVAGDWEPLFSVNASLRPRGGTDFDTDFWREHSTPGTPGFVSNYERVDIISYHGLTGFDDYRGVEGCRRTFAVPPVDPRSIQDRINRHEAAQQPRAEKKSLMFSTDAARIDDLEHFFCDTEHAGQQLGMHVRDGQIDTRLDHASAQQPPQLALKADLRNWAYWCFSRGLGNNLGKYHLQNHSSFQRSFFQMFTAFQQATGVIPLNKEVEEPTSIEE